MSHRPSQNLSRNRPQIRYRSRPTSNRIPSNVGDLGDVAETFAGADAREIQIIVTGVHKIVLASFQSDVIIPGTLDPAGNAAMAKPTQEAYRARAIVCMRLVSRCRNDYRWSLRRTMDNLPEALRWTLEGHDWDPGPKTAIDGAGNTRVCWSPDGVAKFADPLGLL